MKKLGGADLPTRELAAGEVRLELGGVVLSLVSSISDARLNLSAKYMPFISRAVPEVTLSVHHGSAPCLDPGDPLFDSGGIWTLDRVQGKLVIRLRNPGHDLYQLAALDLESALQFGDIYCTGEAWSRPDRRLSFLEYPLGEVLIISLLAQRRGVLLHACGVNDRGRGILFAGTSGAGKSTLATLWEGQAGVTLLSDDRVIVRKREGRFWAYGTPWHGDVPVASPEAVPLERIFIIQHADENRVVPLTPFDAASRLLVRSFPTFWDAEGMAFTLEFLGELSQAVPCYELGFVADESVLDFVRCLT